LPKNETDKYYPDASIINNRSPLQGSIKVQSAMQITLLLII